MPDKHALLKGFVFRLIKRRIAGTTLGAALQEARENSSQGFRTTITFLNNNVDDATKARYNTNTYVQLAKQTGRLHLNTDISLRLSQMGSNINEEILDKCLSDVMKAASASGTTVWFESESNVNMEQLFGVYRKYRKEYKNNIGIEIPLWYPLEVDTIKKYIKSSDRVKLTAYSYRGIEGDKGEKQKKEKRRGNGNNVEIPTNKHIFESYIANISKLLAADVGVAVLDSDEKTLAKLAGFSKEYKKHLIFELPLGCSKRWLNKLTKMKINISIYTPYGKDWTSYLVNRWVSGHERIRGLATKVIGKSSGDVEDEE